MTTQTRRQKLRALAEAHDAWVQRHLADVAAEFEPRGEGSDYNIHNVDVDADGAAQDELAAAATEIFSEGEPLVADAAFEDRHPRDGEGQFTESGGEVEDLSHLTGRAVFNTLASAPNSVDDATAYYKGEGYRELNPALRGERDFESEVGRRRARQLLEALDRRPLEREVVAWRGVGNGPRTLGRAWSDTESLEGVEWVDRSLASSTLDEDVVKRFSGSPHGFVQGVRMRLRVKPGVGAMRISSWSDEAEVLLGSTHGLNYRVVKDNGVTNNVRQLDVEVTPRD